PLQWWHERHQAYPNLSQMACDYLSIPATSVDVERAFSKGGVLLTNRRNRLVGQTIRSLLCLGDWISAGIIKDKDIV
ncbi:hypothetical protein AGABI2DRAFT_56444, partial [Agaricus bisporus var. bisporus H97]|uniref:hypothetical protein n=1 Tax=Agaricus bisporus var. bisporus (strain H97 / ATCC MYA-4626 / FGSC 10389) TaxID=936046 RepID=UPI00029F570F